MGNIMGNILTRMFGCRRRNEYPKFLGIYGNKHIYIDRCGGKFHLVYESNIEITYEDARCYELCDAVGRIKRDENGRMRWEEFEEIKNMIWGIKNILESKECKNKREDPGTNDLKKLFNFESDNGGSLTEIDNDNDNNPLERSMIMNNL